MDRASADAEGSPEESGITRPPSIGVPSIPTRAVPARPPAPVPSVPTGSEWSGGEPGGDPSPGAGSPADADAPVGAEGEDPVTERTPADARPSPPVSRSRRPPSVVSTRTAPLPAEREPSGRGSAETDRTIGTGPAERSVANDPSETAFPPGVAAKLGRYVYLLVAPGTDRVLYVGRGRGDRCFQHVLAARREPSAPPGADDGGMAGGSGAHAHGHHDRQDHGAGPPQSDTDPGAGRRTDRYPALDRIRRAEATEGPVRVEILRYGLSGDEARLVEAATADALGLGDHLRGAGQRQAAADLGIRLAKRAKFKQRPPGGPVAGGGHGDGHRLRDGPPRMEDR